MDNFDELYKDVVVRILEMMKYRGMNQKTLAEALDILPQTITDWKKSKSHSFMQMIYDISQILQSPVRYLMFGDGAKTNEEDALIPKVPWEDRVDATHLTTMEIELIRAYRHADRHTQAIVEVALHPFRKDSASSAG